MTTVTGTILQWLAVLILLPLFIGFFINPGVTVALIAHGLGVW